MLKQKWVDCVIIGSKLHIPERSTAPYIVSISQSLADRTTLVTWSQHTGAGGSVTKGEISRGILSGRKISSFLSSKGVSSTVVEVIVAALVVTLCVD